MAATLDNPQLVAPTPKTETSRPAAKWVGRGLSGVVALFLLVDGMIKLARIPAVLEASEKAGLPAQLAAPIGVLLLFCLALYVIPRTAVLGAVLLTGYLGGAVLAHLRIGDPLLSHTLFPIYVGAALWTGLYLKDDRVRRMLAARGAD